MVGDRLNTDIEFGKAGGLSTLLVLSGTCGGARCGSWLTRANAPALSLQASRKRAR